MSVTTDLDHGGWRLSGRVVLLCLLGFFGVVAAVNAAFIYYAISTFPGLAVESSYKAGQEYEQEVAAGRAQSERAWKVNGEVKPDGPGARVAMTFNDAAGAPVPGLDVEVKLVHAVDPSHDRAVRLVETGAGLYAAAFADLPSGRWYLTVEASRGGERLFKSDNEIKVER